MEIHLQESNPLPLYRQLVDQLQRQISLGVLAAGDKLPTVRELAVLARVNRNTAARAIQALESAGLVHTRVGRGTFVAEGALALGSAALDAAVDRLLDQTLDQALQLGAEIKTLPERLEARIRALAPEEDPSTPPRDDQLREDAP